MPSADPRGRAEGSAGAAVIRGSARAAVHHAGALARASSWHCRCRSPRATLIVDDSVVASPRCGDLPRRIVASQSVGGRRRARTRRCGAYIKKEFSLAVAEQTAEDIKVAMGSAWPCTRSSRPRSVGAISSPDSPDRRGHHRADSRRRRGALAASATQLKTTPGQDATGPGGDTWRAGSQSQAWSASMGLDVPLVKRRGCR